MNLTDLIHRQPVPEPWAEGEKIPWDEPAFSRRMLREHLSQAHDAASRRAATIDAHVRWIHQEILKQQPVKILDLGCGPGLYSNRLAKLGHECVGIDFSPAAIAYAQEHHVEGSTFLEQDIRRAEYGTAYELVMLIFGEFNVFRRADAKTILAKSYHALRPNGRVLLEAHTFDTVRAIGQQRSTWYSAASGLFSEHSHFCLQEYFWDETVHAATERYYILDAAQGTVKPYASSMQAYTEADYAALLQECGFVNPEFYPSLRGAPDASQQALQVIVAHKK